MHKTQATSVSAYHDIKESLGSRQQVVYAYILHRGPVSNGDIADGLSTPINQITPRTNELVAKNLVKESHRGPSNQTGRTVIYWTTQ